MLSYFTRRILISIPTLLFVFTLVFLLVRVAPGDPAIALLGDHAPESVLDAFREKMGLKDPLYIQFWRNLADLLDAPVRTIAGLSNLAAGAIPINRKIALEQAFLPMLAAAGLDMVLLNIFHRPTVQMARTCDALLGDTIFTWVEIADAEEK